MTGPNTAPPVDFDRDRKLDDNTVLNQLKSFWADHSTHAHISADGHTHIHRHEGDLYTASAMWQPAAEGQQVSPDIPLIGDVEVETGHDMVVLPPDGEAIVEAIITTPVHPGGYMFSVWGDVEDVDATDGEAVEARNIDRRQSDDTETVVRADGGDGNDTLFDTSEATFLEWRQRASGEPPARIPGPLMELPEADAVPESGMGFRLQPLDEQFYAGITVLFAEFDEYHG